MRPGQPPMENDETAFLAGAVIVALLIVPMWGDGRGKHVGAIALIVAGVVALPLYVVLFRERLRLRGELRAWAIAAALIPVLVLSVTLVAWLA